MQNINPHRSRWIWLIAALLLCGTVSAILWHLWPQKYSLADPSLYPTLEDLNSAIYESMLDTEHNIWNYDLLASYRIQLKPASNQTLKTQYREWALDFMRRVLDGKEAFLRVLSIGDCGEGHNNSIGEIRFNGEHFIITLDYCYRLDHYKQYGIVQYKVSSLKYTYANTTIHLSAIADDALDPSEQSALSPVTVWIPMADHHDSQNSYDSELTDLICQLENLGLITPQNVPTYHSGTTEQETPSVHKSYSYHY